MAAAGGGSAAGGREGEDCSRPIKSYYELLERTGGVVRGGVGKGTFESLMCFSTL